MKVSLEDYFLQPNCASLPNLTAMFSLDAYRVALIASTTDESTVYCTDGSKAAVRALTRNDNKSGKTDIKTILTVKRETTIPCAHCGLGH